MRWDLTGDQEAMAALIAREEIRDLAHRYHMYAEGGRTADLEDLFAPEAEMEIAWPDRSETFRGRTEVMAIFRRAGDRVGVQAGEEAGKVRYARHHLTTHQVDLLSAVVAKGRWYFVVIVPGGVDHWGRYLDRYVRSADGLWRFTHRRVQVEGLASGSAFRG